MTGGAWYKRFRLSECVNNLILITEESEELNMQNSTIFNHWPTARGSHKSMSIQFGTDRADLINFALTTGDPLADNLAEEMREVGMKRARTQFQLAAQKGIAAVKDPFPSLKSFFEEVEEIADNVDDHLLN